jgi:hypothetical protein
MAAIYPVLRTGFAVDGNTAGFWTRLKRPNREEPNFKHTTRSEWREDEV